jgi:septal ring factor EnvC (AmiA/AmiB activator)
MNKISQEDPYAQLLALPVNFSVDPLVSENSPMMPTPSSAKRQASISSMSSEGESTSDIVSTKKSRLSLDDKDQKTKERILRNRAAAQESRDKKRKYVSDLESANKKLNEENDTMNKRMKSLEHQNAILSSQLMSVTRQLANLQAQIKFNASNPIMFNDFCDSARIAKKELKTRTETEKKQLCV